MQPLRTPNGGLKVIRLYVGSGLQLDRNRLATNPLRIALNLGRSLPSEAISARS
jgi:hypothetical protein